MPKKRLSPGLLAAAIVTTCSTCLCAGVRESARALPLVDKVDVVVAGGSTAAVSAALEARNSGASVLLVTPYTYLGRDLVATRRLDLEPISSADPLFTRLLADPKAVPFEDGKARWIRPLHVKKVFEEALLASEVKFLFGCFPTELLTDEQGRAAGIVIASRSGRQAIAAKVVIDATLTGHLCPGPRENTTRKLRFQWTVAIAEGHNTPETAQGRVRSLAAAIDYQKGRRKKGQARLYRVSLEADVSKGLDWAEVNRINHRLIQESWSPGLVEASEIPCFHSPVKVKCVSQIAGSWPGAEKAETDAFIPAGTQGLYVLSSASAVEDTQAMQEANQQLLLGRKIGRSAARQAAQTPDPRHLRVRLDRDQPGQDVRSSGEIRENLRGLRGLEWQGPAVSSPGGMLPVLAQVDVVVVGGGTGGAPAGIAAAKAGAKVLVLEFLHGLGGVSTLGRIPRYYHGYREGFTKQIDAGVRSLTGASEIQVKMEWYRRRLLSSGAEVWFGVLGCGALVRDDTLGGVVVATPMGRGVVLAKRVIDATGNSDIAAAAGAQCREPGRGHLAVQGAGLPPIQPGQGYRNTDYAFAIDHDVVDMWRFFLKARRTFSGSYDSGTLIDTRERRRIVGEITVSPLDIYMQKRYGDTICLAKSNFDTHGYTVHPLFLLEAPDRKAILADVPLRALMPENINALLVTGLGISADRDAMPLLRMQPDVQNQGYAAGYISAVSVRQNQPLRSVDIREIQKHLVEMGIVPKRVLSEQDSMPPSKQKILDAVKKLPSDPAALAWILARLDVAIPAMREQMNTTKDPKARLRYAQVLGMCSDPAGADILAKAIAETPWDKGWRYRGMGQYGQSISRLDSLIIALGRTGGGEHADVLIRKASRLGPDPELSHCRALATALESLGIRRGADALAKLLEGKGISGHAVTTAENIPTGARDNRTRSRELRELLLARACYALGDSNGLARGILEQYAQDLRGLYARGARDALANEPGSALKK